MGCEGHISEQSEWVWQEVMSLDAQKGGATAIVKFIFISNS